MLWAVILITSIAFFGEAMFGFGGGLIAVPLLSTIIGVKNAVTFTLIFQVFMGTLMIWNHKHIHKSKLCSIVIAILVGSIAGTYSLSVMNEQYLRVFLGAFIILYLCKIVFANSLSLPWLNSSTGAPIINLFGGWVQGAIGTAGPVFIMHLSECKLNKTVLRSTLITYLFFSNILRVPASITSGLFSHQVLTYALYSAPFFIISITLGQKLHHQFNEKGYRIVVYTLLLCSSITLLLQGN